MNSNCLKLACVMATIFTMAKSEATPQFAKQFSLSCTDCHSHVPKLNAFGKRFASNGFTIEGVTPKSVSPIAVWASLNSQNPAAGGSRYKTFPNRVELVSAFSTPDKKTSVFIEWRVLSRELLSNNSVRDRSGRFEDLYVITKIPGKIQLQVGQFRVFSQIDVSQRLTLAEPATLGNSLAGNPHPDSRIQSLRGFSLAGRSPAVRASVQSGNWDYVVTVPFPGEWSLPLTEQAKTTASSEIEGKAKGVLLEVSRKLNQASIGAFGFSGSRDREMVGLSGTFELNQLIMEGVIYEANSAAGRETRSMLGVDWIPLKDLATGFRIDHHHKAGEKPLAVLYVSKTYETANAQMFKLVTEARARKGQKPRFVIELGLLF